MNGEKDDTRVLTIAVPTFNMESCLGKNLQTYYDDALIGKLEVLILNNASEDRSGEIAGEYCRRAPELYRLMNRGSRGYGSSVNEAIQAARGTYFRIVDADDWVDTKELLRLVRALESCTADAVLTNYALVDMETQNMTPVTAEGVEYGTVYTDLKWPARTLPSIHGTTYRTEILRGSGFYMQDGIFFVDEEYVILPYLYISTVIYYPFNVYRYQVANPNQSTSPLNRARYQEHRERILRRLIRAFYEAKGRGAPAGALAYCYERIRRGAGDHFTTLYMYVESRRDGAALARRWRDYLKTLPEKELYRDTRIKATLLHILNAFHISLPFYRKLKIILGGKRT